MYSHPFVSFVEDLLRKGESKESRKEFHLSLLRRNPTGVGSDSGPVCLLLTRGEIRKLCG